MNKGFTYPTSLTFRDNLPGDCRRSNRVFPRGANTPQLTRCEDADRLTTSRGYRAASQARARPVGVVHGTRSLPACLAQPADLRQPLAAALYKTFAQEAARWLARRVEFVYAPVHGSWPSATIPASQATTILQVALKDSSRLYPLTLLAGSSHTSEHPAHSRLAHLQPCDLLQVLVPLGKRAGRAPLRVGL